VARDPLTTFGLTGLSMSEIAEEAGYTRTALYRYFPSKEELVSALAIESVELRLKLFERIEGFDARPRERFVAFGEVSAILYPRHVLAEVIAFAKAVRAKTSPERQKQLRELEREDYLAVLRVGQEAVESGDLMLPPHLSLEEMLFGVSAFTRGVFDRVVSAAPPAEIGVPDPRAVLRKMGAQLLDSVPWHPLSTEWDYRETMRRIYSELFTPEFLAPLGLPAARVTVAPSTASQPGGRRRKRS
jgi:AcrR family transcriptional regulator